VKEEKDDVSSKGKKMEKTSGHAKEEKNRSPNNPRRLRTNRLVADSPRKTARTTTLRGRKKFMPARASPLQRIRGVEMKEEEVLK